MIYFGFMTKELETVVLTEPVAEHSLQRDDVGTVVHVFRDGEAYEVEFVTLSGETAALATLRASQFRSVGKRDILHVRDWKGEPLAD
jgi:hypothetical protein